MADEFNVTNAGGSIWVTSVSCSGATPSGQCVRCGGAIYAGAAHGCPTDRSPSKRRTADPGPAVARGDRSPGEARRRRESAMLRAAGLWGEPGVVLYVDGEAVRSTDGVRHGRRRDSSST